MYDTKKNNTAKINRLKTSKNNINKKNLYKNEFNLKFGNNFVKKYLQNENGSNIVIMYDLDAPNGFKSKNNKKYLHYLSISNEVFVSYVPPTPPQGKHRYIVKKLFLDSKNIFLLKKKLAKKNLNNRKNIQSLSKFHIMGINFNLGIKKRKIFYVSKRNQTTKYK